MRSAWTPSPWVEEHRDGVSFALHVFPIDTPVDPAGAHVSPLPLQRPSSPIMIAGSGERVTLRQVARSADACNIMQIDPFGGGLLSPEAVANKLAVLHRHCEEIGRPFETVLRTYTTGWTILAQDER